MVRAFPLTGLLTLLLPAAALFAEEAAGVKDLVRSLNGVTGESAMSARIGQFRAGERVAFKKTLAAAAALAKEKDNPFTYTSAYILARSAYLVNDYDHSEELYKVCLQQALKLQSPSKLVTVLDDLFDLSVATKKYDLALATGQQILELKTNGNGMNYLKVSVLEKMFGVMSRQGKYDDALKQVERLVELDQGGFYFVFLKGNVLRQAGRLDDAVKTYEECIDLLTKKKDALEAGKDDAKGDDDGADAAEVRKKKVKDYAAFADNARYFLTSVYSDLNKPEKAAEILQQLIKSNPDSATYLNDLGYLWAERGLNLDESEKMIRKALEIDAEKRKKLKEENKIGEEDDRDRAAYLDSLGWVLFKKKQFAEAKKYLDDAIKDESSQHVEIYDHLAEVNAALGNKEEALKLWKKGLELENVTKRDDERKAEVRKKIEAAEAK